MQPVQDRFGRGFSGLRVSVTQRCNLACPHCHREGQIRSGEEMEPEEIGKIVAIAASLGASKVKITGGEPLMRDDICEIVSAIRPHVREISMTTNGILLDTSATTLREAGLDRINISVHSLSREVLKSISGRDCLDDVKRGVSAAAMSGLKPIKLNMVVLRGINDKEIFDMMRFASQHDAVLQLIELASDRSGCNDDYFVRHHYSLGELENYLAENAIEITHNELHRRARFAIKENGGIIRTELVRSMHNSIFCANCTRLRLTSDGKLKGCLYDNGHSPNLLEALRGDATMEELKELFLSSIVNRKPYWS